MKNASMRGTNITPEKVSRAVVLIRVMVGGVFFVEGILKFLYSGELAAGRFERVGIPLPQIMGPFVGGVEVICGALVLLGLLTRLAAIALLIDISVAILSTRIPILFGHGFWRFTLAKLPHYGWLSMIHEARTDFSMWLGLIFLFFAGGGCWALEARFGKRRSNNQKEKEQR